MVDCFSEFLPTAAYVGVAGVNAAPASLNFRLTARDQRPGGGGIGFADTRLVLAQAAGPFLVTSQATAESVAAGSSQAITWDVAGTNLPPVSTENVKISLSLDGGWTYPVVLAESTANDGSESFVLPNVDTATARVKVEAVGNVYFDISQTDFTVRGAARQIAELAAFVDGHRAREQPRREGPRRRREPRARERRRDLQPAAGAAERGGRPGGRLPHGRTGRRADDADRLDPDRARLLTEERDGAPDDRRPVTGPD